MVSSLPLQGVGRLRLWCLQQGAVLLQLDLGPTLRALRTASLHQRMAQSFPEMCQGPQATARVQFVLSALRGMGLVAPFSPAAAMPAQLQVLSQYLQSFQPQET